MSWIVSGNDEQATLACNTGMTAFGPLHQNFGAGSAEEELLEFAGDYLNRDPRKYNEDELLMYWRQYKKEKLHP